MRPVDNAPKIVADVWRRLARLYHRPKAFEELTARNLVGPWAKLRARRSSRREAWLLVMRALAARWDRRTDRCGTPRGDRRDSADCPSIADLVTETGCSRGRVVRALRDFRQAGYLKSHRVVEAYDAGNRYCGLPSVRTLQPVLFRRLGISDRKRERARGQGAAKWKQQRGPAASAIGLQKVRRELQQQRAGWRRFQVAAPAAPLEPGTPRRRAWTPEAQAEQLAKLAKLYGEPPPEKP